MRTSMFFFLLAAACGSNTIQADGGQDSAIQDEGTMPTEAGADDGSLGDVSVDAGDVSQPPARVACGTGYCRTDEQCSNGACTVACQGNTVPGDYATLHEALTALGQAGVDATVCLGAQTFAESASAQYAANGMSLTIIGPPGASVTALDVSAAFSKVTLRGFTVKDLVLSSSAPIDVVGLRASYVQVTSTQKNEVLLDGCDLGNDSTESYALYVTRVGSSSVSIDVRNSWIHGESYGVYYYANQSSGTDSVSLVNDTIEGNQTGIFFVLSSANVALTYVNDMIVNNSYVGVSLTGVSTPTYSNNLLYGNASNYAGLAVDGPGYVKSDPMLDGDTPPGPKSGSPARGAASKTAAPSNDYWNVSRGSSPDIGAVQGS